MQIGYVLYCAECGESKMEIGYAPGDAFPDQPLMLCAHCPQCGSTGWIKGLSVASMKIRAEVNSAQMARAIALKHVALGIPESPSVEDVERWAKRAADEGHREMNAEDRRKAREFLEFFPEVLVAEAGEGRSESSEKRAKTKTKPGK